MTTQAQVDANRKNATRSTGSRTVEGKAISRGNALKHGLAGAGVVIRDDEAAEVERRSLAYVAQLRPRNEVSRNMINRAAVLSIRVERCAGEEIVAISARGVQAEQEYEDHVDRKIETLFQTLCDAPLLNLRKLLATDRGVARLIAGWNDFKSDLDTATWSLKHGERLANLKGYRADECHAETYHDLSEAILGIVNPDRQNQSRLIREDLRPTWAREELQKIVNEEIAGLEEYLESMEPTDDDCDRRNFINLARLTPTAEILLIRKYEAAAERNMYKALKEARLLDALPAPNDQANPEAEAITTDGDEASVELASFLPGLVSPWEGIELDPNVDSSPLTDKERYEFNRRLRSMGPEFAHLIREVGMDGETLPAPRPRS